MLRRLALRLALGLLAFVAGAVVAHALHAQAPDPAGCVVRPDGAPLVSTPLLDSAGVRVTQRWAAAARDESGGTRWCPWPDFAITTPRIVAAFTAGDPPFVRWRVDSLAAAPLWRVGADSSLWPDAARVDSLWRRTDAFRSWRGTLAVLLAQFPAEPPAAADPCAAAPFRWAPVDGGQRRDDVRLVDGAACRAVVTLDGARFAVVWPPCDGATWRRHGVTYTTRTAALDRARRVPACPSPARRS